MPPGQIFHVVTRGSGRMPSYAAQIPPDERWLIVQYVQTLQAGEGREHGAGHGGGGPGAPPTSRTPRARAHRPGRDDRRRGALAWSPERTWPNLLLSNVYLLSMALSGALFLCIPVPLRRRLVRRPAPRAGGHDVGASRDGGRADADACSSAARAVLWADAGGAGHAPLPGGQGRSISSTPFVFAPHGGRARAVGLAGASACGRTSLRQDDDPAPAHHQRLVRHSAVFAVVFAVTFCTRQRRLADVARPALVQHDLRGLRVRGRARVGPGRADAHRAPASGARPLRDIVGTRAISTTWASCSSRSAPSGPTSGCRSTC